MKLKAMVLYWTIVIIIIGTSMYKYFNYKMLDGVVIAIEEYPDHLSFDYVFEFRYGNLKKTDKTKIGDYKKDRYFIGEKIKILSNGKDSLIYDFYQIILSKILILFFVYIFVFYLIIPFLSSF